MAAWCTKHTKGVIAAWLAVLFLALGVGFALGGERNRADFRMPGTDSQATNDLMQREFPGERGDVEAIVVSTPTGTLLAGKPLQSAERLFQQLRDVPGVRSVSDPLSNSASINDGALSVNRRTAIAILRFEQGSLDVPDAAVTQLVADLNASRTAGFTATAMGWAVENSEIKPPVTTEIVGFLAAAIVLVLALGSVVAGGIALGNALIAIGVSSSVLQIVSHLVNVPYFGPQVALTVGLGIAIDYGLLTVARYRGARERAQRGGTEVGDALRRTSRTVAFAGGTMLIAILGLLMTPISMVRGMTVAIAVAVVPAVLAANTLLPALLHLFDAHLDRGRPIRRRGEILESSATWGRWSQAVQRRPVAALLGAVTLLCLLAAPILSLRLGPADGSTDNPSSLTARAYRTASEAFGPGATAPLQVVAHAPAHLPVKRSVDRLRQSLVAMPGVLVVTPPTFGRDHHYVMLDVIPTTAPNDPATTNLLHRIRTSEYDAMQAHGISLGVGGQTALQYDMASTIHRAFPMTVVMVIASSFLLLLLQFRSLAIAAKAGVMNLLSISAAFGITVAIFQWGWGIHLFGISHAGPVHSLLPLLLFPTLFGLSMDYEVFLMARISDEWERTHDATGAITAGIASTARVVTSGAAIMFALFSAMALSSSRTVATFGVGLALAVLLDATVIRSVLLPAAMQLLGRYNWWLPTWLHRRLPVLRPV
ncbi:MAG TPA: MMPL family transporter [Mycobacteriales bacterium]|nr:MMPL family transporter [Mycobacteriales bacterium]